MDKSQINLNHFEFKILKNKTGDRLQTIAVTSKSFYEQLYSDVYLDYIFQSESKFSNIDSQNNIIINKINTTQERSLIATIYARLNRAIKDKEVSTPKSDNLDNLLSDDFNFSELDEPKPSSDFTYSCPKCNSGILRVKTISGDKFHWTCINTTNCNSVYADFRGRPIGENLNYIAEVVVDENTSVSVDDFDFDDDVLSKYFNSKESLIAPKHLNDDFNFDEFDDPEPQLVGNEIKAQKDFPKNFDFDTYIVKLMDEMLEYQKELCKSYIERQNILQQQKALQLELDRLEKQSDRLSNLYDDTQDGFEHAVERKFKT